MKKVLSVILFVVLGLVILGRPVQTRAEEDWRIDSFNDTLAIQNDGRVLIDEEIQADFAQTPKHGIYRDIPYAYKTEDGQKTYITLQVQSVEVDGHTVPYTNDKDNSYIHLKIGDPNLTITGSHDYHIIYEATGILRGFPQYDELYWNATGNDWQTTIEQASATVILPKNGVVQATCYIGKTGATTSCEKSQISDPEVQFKTSQALAPGEGLTVAVGFTKGMVPLLTVANPHSALKTGLSLGIILLLGLGGLLPWWWKRARDQRYVGNGNSLSGNQEERLPFFTHEVITPEYAAPEGLRPGEIGVLIDERADTVDVSASIVDLATRGFLTITEIPAKGLFGKVDYQLEQLGKPATDLLGYESELLGDLFAEGKTVKISSLKNSFYKKLALLQKSLYSQVVAKKLFIENPQAVRTRYGIYAVIIGGVGYILLTATRTSTNPYILGGGLGLLIVGTVCLITSFFMPRRTAYGHAVYRKVLGYRLFVSNTEKYRQPFLENQNIFLDILPYAMIFGVTHKLAKAMASMNIAPVQPVWYYSPNPFNIASFGSSMDTFSTMVTKTIASSPSSSGSGGGGFSGGGFGGGGGGSW